MEEKQKKKNRKQIELYLLNNDFTNEWIMFIRYGKRKKNHIKWQLIELNGICKTNGIITIWFDDCIKCVCLYLCRSYFLHSLINKCGNLSSLKKFRGKLLIFKNTWTWTYQMFQEINWILSIGNKIRILIVIDDIHL